MKLLILGANGFIGSSIVQKIINDTKWEIYAIDLASHKIQQFLDHPRFNFIEGSVFKNMNWIEKHIKYCDVIFPLIAIANPSFYISNSLYVYQLGFESNIDIIKLCVKYKKYLIFPSSSEVYGMNSDIPFHEETSNFVTGPINKSRWIYSSAKQLLDRVIYAYGIEKKLRYTLFRPFNWIGPKQDEITSSVNGSSRVLIQFICNILNNKDLKLVNGGMQKRCFTYIDDGIDALIKIIKLRNTTSYQKIFNLGNPNNECSIKDLALLIIKTIKSYTKYKNVIDNINIIDVDEEKYYGIGYQDINQRIPSIENAKKYLDWSPKISLQESINKIVKYHLKIKI